MSKFNTTVKPRVADTFNRAGGEAFDKSAESRLVSLMLSSFLTDQFYRSGDEALKELQELVGQVRPDFAAKAAIFARDEFGMRSVSHVVAGELCRYVKGESWMRGFFKRVVIRPDDVTEILSYWMSNYGKPIPNAMKRGLGDALASFDAYRLGKYKAEGKSLSLVDAVNLTHPRGNEQLTALMNGTLTPPETWEVLLTQAGSDPEKKAEVWEKLLRGNQLGYFALLRNLRNIIAQAPDAVSMACDQLVNPNAIKKSRVLPFRFLSAWDALAENPDRQVLMALSEATDIAVSNVPVLDGKTLVAVDSSGSMTMGRGKNGHAPIAIAGLFAAAVYKTMDAHIMLFDGEAKWPQLNPADSALSIAKHLRDRANGGTTDFHLVFDKADRPYDRIVIFSDMQAWVASYNWGYRRTISVSESFMLYKKRYNIDPPVYCFDLGGYGTSQFPEAKVAQLYGWSDKVFDYMRLSERGSDALVDAVKAVVL